MWIFLSGRDFQKNDIEIKKTFFCCLLLVFLLNFFCDFIRLIKIIFKKWWNNMNIGEIAMGKLSAGKYIGGGDGGGGDGGEDLLF